MIRIGIDNGLDGAIVALDSYRPILAEPMPTLKGRGNKRSINMHRVHEILRMYAGMADVFAVLEQAQAMPKQGGVSMFNYGVGYGAMQMALLALGIPHEIVNPKVWQKDVGIKKGDTKGQAIAIVQRRIPQLDLTPGAKRVPHNGLADAACMALHGYTLRPLVNPRRNPPPPPPPPR